MNKCAWCKKDYPEEMLIQTCKGKPVCEYCIQEQNEVNAEMAEERAKESGDIEYD